MVAKGIKRKRKSSRPLPSRSKTFKEALGGAVGAALGSLVGAAFVRDPKGMTDMVTNMVKLAGDPRALEEMLKSAIPQNEWTVAPHPTPVGPSGPFSGPEGQALSEWFTKECDKIRTAHPSWGAGRVSDEAIIRARKAGKIPSIDADFEPKTNPRKRKHPHSHPKTPQPTAI